MHDVRLRVQGLCHAEHPPEEQAQHHHAAHEGQQGQGQEGEARLTSARDTTSTTAAAATAASTSGKVYSNVNGQCTHSQLILSCILVNRDVNKE